MNPTDYFYVMSASAIAIFALVAPFVAYAFVRRVNDQRHATKQVNVTCGDEEIVAKGFCMAEAAALVRDLRHDHTGHEGYIGGHTAAGHE